jgi:hypothetical protein
LTVRAEFNEAAQLLRTILKAHDAGEPPDPQTLPLPNLDVPHDVPLLRIWIALTIAINTVSANMTLRRRAQWEDQRQRLSTWLHDLEKINHLTEDNAALSAANLARDTIRSANELLSNAQAETAEDTETMQALAQVVRQLSAVLERIGTRLEPILRTMSASNNAATDATAWRRLPSKVQAELKHEQAQTYGHLSALLKTTLQLDTELATMSVAKFVRSYGPAEDAPDTRSARGE